MVCQWLQLVCISVVFTDVNSAEIPCIFPTCDLPPANCRVVKDAKGCPTCNYVCRYGSRVCREIWCSNFCADGFAMDRAGCQTCYCKAPRYQPPPAPPPSAGCYATCSTGVCPNSCNCQPYCYSPAAKPQVYSEPEEPNEMNGGK
ncbi:hypothetical protein BsWGS_24083 [Bradybaena similaris]